jgi:hypothetical protein
MKMKYYDLIAITQESLKKYNLRTENEDVIKSLGIKIIDFSKDDYYAIYLGENVHVPVCDEIVYIAMEVEGKEYTFRAICLYSTSWWRDKKIKPNLPDYEIHIKLLPSPINEKNKTSMFDLFGISFGLGTIFALLCALFLKGK